MAADMNMLSRSGAELKALASVLDINVISILSASGLIMWII